MGRKFEIKRIEDDKKRRRVFATRKTTLFKKAKEISQLCESDVAVVVFSEDGRLSEFSMNDSVQRLIDRYNQCKNSVPHELEKQDNFTRQYYEQQEKALLNLHSFIIILEKQNRNLMGEDLGNLGIEELVHLEYQLQIGVSKIRSRKVKSRSRDRNKSKSTNYFTNSLIGIYYEKALSTLKDKLISRRIKQSKKRIMELENENIDKIAEKAEPTLNWDALI